MNTRINQTTIVTLACLALLAGLVFGRHMITPGWVLLFGLIGLIALWRTRLQPLAIMMLFLALGLWRGGQVLRHDQTLTQLMGQKANISGTIKDDPSLNDNNQLSFTVATDRLNGHQYDASISIYTYRLPVKRGYQILATGKLKPTMGASQAEISFPTVQITSTHLNWLERWRLRFFAAERTAIPEPLASFALGLLIGARALIPKSLQAQLAAVGLSHLVAVSGYNLTILVNGVRRLFGKANKFIILAASLWLIAGFVVVAGASASIIRATVVSVLVLGAGYYGRSIKPAVLIAVAAALTAGFNPHALWSDLGWQLSFAAFVGILMLAPVLSKRLGGERHAGLALVCEALSAYVLTLPLLLHSFGTLSPIAPLVNVIVMPLVPLAMLLSFVAGLAAMIIPMLGGWISWPAVVMLRFMVGLVEQASRLTPGSVDMSVVAMVLWYALIGLVIVLLNRPPNRPTAWYNKEKEAPADVRTLQVE